MFAFIASHLVRNLAKYAAGSGISEIKCILAGFVMKGYLGFATFLIKSITLVCPQILAIRFKVFSDVNCRVVQPLVIASGLSVGKEGPSVHVACCIGSLVARLFDRFSRSQSEFWSSGAVLFNETFKQVKCVKSLPLQVRPVSPLLSAHQLAVSCSLLRFFSP